MCDVEKVLPAICIFLPKKCQHFLFCFSLPSSSVLNTRLPTTAALILIVVVVVVALVLVCIQGECVHFLELDKCKRMPVDVGPSVNI